MESSLFIRCCTPPNRLFQNTSAVDCTGLTRSRYSFCRSSLSFLKNYKSKSKCKCQPVFRHTLGPITCSTNGFSTPSANRKNYNIGRGTPKVSLVLACVLGIISYICVMKNKAIARADTPGPESTTPEDVTSVANPNPKADAKDTVSASPPKKAPETEATSSTALTKMLLQKTLGSNWAGDYQPYVDQFLTKVTQDYGEAGSETSILSEGLKTLLSENKEATEESRTSKGRAARVLVQGRVLVSPEIESTVEQIFAKYGDITANCILKDKMYRGDLINGLVTVVKRLQDYQNLDLTSEELESVDTILADLEVAKVDVAWLRSKFEEVRPFMRMQMLKSKRKKMVEEKDELRVKIEKTRSALAEQEKDYNKHLEDLDQIDQELEQYKARKPEGSKEEDPPRPRLL